MKNLLKENFIKYLKTYQIVLLDEKTEKSGEDIIQNTEKLLFDLAERGAFSQSFLKFDQALDQTIEMATNAMKNDQGIVGIPTGLKRS